MFSIKDELAANAPDWATIYDDILRCIADMTHSVKDRIRMAAVCQAWQVPLKDQKLNFPVCLMLAETKKNGRRCFYNTSEEIFVELDLSELRGKRCWGSRFGWLVTCGIDLEIQLFNPLSRATLPLPSLLTQRHRHDHVLPSDDYFPLYSDSDDEDPTRPQHERWCKYLVQKLVLSSDPTSTNPDCMVLAIYSSYVLAFAKPGSEAWTPIDYIGAVQDALCFDGKFYACLQSGEVFLCKDLDESHPRAVKFAPPPPQVSVVDTKYLFDLGGNFCLASRGKLFVDDEDDEREIKSCETNRFEIFRLDMVRKSWERIYSMGDCSLFLGNCTTFTICVADYPGCKPNCIYLTDDDPLYYDTTKGLDMGIYDCKNLKLDLHVVDEPVAVEPFPKSKDVQHLLSSTFSPPLWIIPCSR